MNGLIKAVFSLVGGVAASSFLTDCAPLTPQARSAIIIGGEMMAASPSSNYNQGTLGFILSREYRRIDNNEANLRAAQAQAGTQIQGQGYPQNPYPQQQSLPQFQNMPYQAQVAELIENKRDVVFTCNGYKDFDQDWEQDADEFIGVKTIFSIREPIIIYGFFHNEVGSTVTATISGTEYEPSQANTGISAAAIGLIAPGLLETQRHTDVTDFPGIFFKSQAVGLIHPTKWWGPGVYTTNFYLNGLWAGSATYGVQ